MVVRGSSYSFTDDLKIESHNLPKSYSPDKEIEAEEGSPNNGRLSSDWFKEIEEKVKSKNI